MFAPTITAMNRLIGRTDSPSAHVTQPKAPEDVDINQGYYVHTTKLGEGGFGTVRLATHYKTNQKVAIKKMNKLKLGGDLFRVKTEISALKVLNHDNIAQLLQVIETQDTIYLVLEYCSGGELFDYLISKQRLPESEAKEIMRSLVDVLKYIHESGFAHRDLKPENIMFDRNHKIKLIDFGLSAHCRSTDESQVHLKTCCGSPAYAAPELLKGMGYSGPSVDIWSAGVLLYALLTGELPFADNNLPVLYRKIQLGNYKIPQFLSNEANDLIGQMLRTDPNARANINEIKAHPWLRPSLDDSFSLSDIPVKPTINEVLDICRALKFSTVDRKSLERQILCDYGYNTATYWLIKNNPSVYQSLKSEASPLIPHMKLDRRRSRSVSNIAAAVESAEYSPKAVSAKRKPEFETLKGFQVKKPSPNGAHKPKPSPLAVSRNDGNNTPTRIPAVRRVAYKPTAKANDSIRMVRARLQSVDGVSPAKTARVLAPINDTYCTPDRRQKSFVAKTPNLNQTTGQSSTAPKTEKKSLLKRLLESATPTKRVSPRVVRLSGADSKNITRTEFTDPQQLIAQLVEVLAKRNVLCTHKSNFLLRCVLSSMNTIVLSFNLEVCKTDEMCVIFRKRLKGSAWDYKRICDDIDGLSANSLIDC